MCTHIFPCAMKMMDFHLMTPKCIGKLIIDFHCKLAANSSLAVSSDEIETNFASILCLRAKSLIWQIPRSTPRLQIELNDFPLKVAGDTEGNEGCAMMKPHSIRLGKNSLVSMTWAEPRGWQFEWNLAIVQFHKFHSHCLPVHRADKRANKEVK